MMMAMIFDTKAKRASTVPEALRCHSLTKLTVSIHLVRRHISITNGCLRLTI